MLVLFTYYNIHLICRYFLIGRSYSFSAVTKDSATVICRMEKHYKLLKMYSSLLIILRFYFILFYFRKHTSALVIEIIVDTQMTFT